MALGKLKKIDLRTYWKHEAKDFSTWLAEPENLEMLSEEIGIDISSIKTEANVGRFSVDILAEEPNTGRKIIIENQLEKTNHDHLGKLITYASGIDADIIVWIVKDVLDEHKQAIDWLNENTNEALNFFIIKMALWQIGNSSFAPHFEIISKPNDWAKAVKASASNTQLSRTKLMQLDFWNKFKEYANRRRTKLHLRKTYPQQWYDISYGSSEAHICLTLYSQKNLIGCEIYIPDSKETYERFHSKKRLIEKELGMKLEWKELQEKKASRIRMFKNANLNNTNEWEKYFEWMITNAEKFKNTFSKYE